MTTRKTTLKSRIKGKLSAWVTAGSSSENYGFGSNWSLNIGKKGTPIKSMWLGQGAKVTSRMLGSDYNDYVKSVSERVKAKKQFKNEHDWLSNKKINKEVTGDILHASFGDEWIQDELGGGWTGEINSKRLKKLIGVEDWGLAVQ
jgi:hypothetical protein